MSVDEFRKTAIYGLLRRVPPVRSSPIELDIKSIVKDVFYIITTTKLINDVASIERRNYDILTDYTLRYFSFSKTYIDREGWADDSMSALPKVTSC